MEFMALGFDAMVGIGTCVLAAAAVAQWMGWKRNKDKSGGEPG